MSPAEKNNRLRLAVLYFIVAYGVLFWYSYDDYFCLNPNSAPQPIITARLALACTLWDTLVGFGIAFTVNAIGEFGRIVPFWATIVTGIGFASIPFWIYRGYGQFLFEHTWADVRCFFTTVVRKSATARFSGDSRVAGKSRW